MFLSHKIGVRLQTMTYVKTISTQICIHISVLLVHKTKGRAVKHQSISLYHYALPRVTHKDKPCVVLSVAVPYNSAKVG